MQLVEPLKEFFSKNPLPMLEVPACGALLHRNIGLEHLSTMLTEKHAAATHLHPQNYNSTKIRFGGQLANGEAGPAVGYYGQSEGVLGEDRHYSRLKGSSSLFSCGIQYQLGTIGKMRLFDLSHPDLQRDIDEIVARVATDKRVTIDGLFSDDLTVSVAFNTALKFFDLTGVDGHFAPSARSDLVGNDVDANNILLIGEPGRPIPILRLESMRIASPQGQQVDPRVGDPLLQIGDNNSGGPKDIRVFDVSPHGELTSW